MRGVFCVGWFLVSGFAQLFVVRDADVLCREKLQSVPENLEAKISEKKFLGAINILNDALAITKTPEIGNISALADTKAYVASQETVRQP